MNSTWKIFLVGLTIISITFSSTLIVIPVGCLQEPEITRDFWAKDFDTESHYQIPSTLLATGEHCLIYMQDSLIPIIGITEAQSRCESYRDEFDTVIYDIVVDLTGNPDGIIGDVDGDPRIVILINDNWVSYYSQWNEIVHEYSNLCEMIYIYYDNFLILDTIAHEFCHLIWFNYEFDEVHFLLEGLAEYATYKCGYLESNNNESTRTSYFLEDSNDPLIYFDVAARDYGDSYLFTFYLAERFGVQFLQDLVQQENDGAHGLESALDDAGYNISFNQLYLDWITALTIDELGFDDDKYGFQNLDATIQDTTGVNSLPFEVETLDVWCYSPTIYELNDLANGFTVETSEPSSGMIGLSIASRDTDGWHINQLVSSEPINVNIAGSDIDSAYVIITYFYASTPAGAIDFGVGMSEDVSLSITPYVGTGSTGNTSPISSASNGESMVIVYLIVCGGVISLVIVLAVFSKISSAKS